MNQVTELAKTPKKSTPKRTYGKQTPRSSVKPPRSSAADIIDLTSDAEELTLPAMPPAGQPVPRAPTPEVEIKPEPQSEQGFDEDAASVSASDKDSERARTPAIYSHHQSEASSQVATDDDVDDPMDVDDDERLTEPDVEGDASSLSGNEKRPRLESPDSSESSNSSSASDDEAQISEQLRASNTSPAAQPVDMTANEDTNRATSERQYMPTTMSDTSFYNGTEKVDMVSASQPVRAADKVAVGRANASSPIQARQARSKASHGYGASLTQMNSEKQKPRKPITTTTKSTLASTKPLSSGNGQNRTESILKEFAGNEDGSDSEDSSSDDSDDDIPATPYARSTNKAQAAATPVAEQATKPARESKDNGDSDSDASSAYESSSGDEVFSANAVKAAQALSKRVSNMATMNQGARQNR